jgi:phosphoglycerate-specific signal transduction histidine kinase
MVDGKTGEGPEQQQLFQSQRSAEPRDALLRLRERLLAKAAHEIYNSSTFVVANLTTLRGDILAGELDADLAVEMLDECLEGMGRTTDVLRRTRKFSREKTASTMESVDLSAVVHQICLRLVERKGFQVDTDLNDVQVRADLDALVLAVELLIEVWLHRLPPLEASVGLGLQIRAREVDGGGLLEVRDLNNQAGELLSEDLFTPFRKGDSAEHGTRLYLARSLIEDMGGRLQGGMDAAQAVLSVFLPRP